MTQPVARAPENLVVTYGGVDISAIGMESFDPAIGEETSPTTHIKSGLASSARLRNTATPTARIRIDDSATGQAIKAVIYDGNIQDLVWGPEGTTSGKPKWGFKARCNVNYAIDMGSVQVMDVSWESESDDWAFNGDAGDTF